MDKTLVIETDLLLRISSGDTLAERELFRHYHVVERVVEMVRVRVNAPPEDRHDLVSEILLAILINLRRGSYDTSRGEFGSYIWGISRNKIRDYLKPAPDRFTLPLFDEIISEQHDLQIEERDQREVLRSEIGKLAVKYRQVLFLRYFEDLSIEEISQRLEISPPQVYNRIHYAINLLRDRVKK